MDTKFWKTLPGVATILAVVTGGAWALAKATSPHPAATPTPVPPVPTPANSSYYLFYVTTPYASSASNATAGQVTAVTDALTKAGFTNLQIEADPQNAYGWVATGLWVGSGTPTMAGVDGSISNAQKLASNPPTPTQYSNLVYGNWYTFSIQTSFSQTQTQAQQNAAALVAGLGFDPASIMITPAADPTGVTWNIAAKWTGGGTSSANASSITADAPPLLIIVPPGPYNVGTTQPPQPTTAMP